MMNDRIDYKRIEDIVREAGGIITDMEGNPMPLEGKSSVICGNRKSWDDVRKILGNVTEEPM